MSCLIGSVAYGAQDGYGIVRGETECRLDAQLQAKFMHRLDMSRRGPETTLTLH